MAVSLVTGFLDVTCPIDFTEPDPANIDSGDLAGGKGKTGRIDVAMVAMIPEPFTAALYTATMGPVVLGRRFPSALRVRHSARGRIPKSTYCETTR